MMAVSPDDVVLSVLPLPHAFGFHGSLLAPLLRGSRVVILDRFSPEAVLTTQQVAQWLSVSRRTVQRLRIPTVQLGHRTIRYRAKDVLDYLERAAR